MGDQALNGAAATAMMPDRSEHEPVKLEVRLSTKQVMAGLSMLGAGVVALIGAGWIALPAKERDLTAVQQNVSVLKQTVETLADGMKGLGEQTRRLTEAVEGLKGTVVEAQYRAQPTASRKPRPLPKANPAGAAGGLGIFGN
jgi:hypothetical protein